MKAVPQAVRAVLPGHHNSTSALPEDVLALLRAEADISGSSVGSGWIATLPTEP